MKREKNEPVENENQAETVTKKVKKVQLDKRIKYILMGVLVIGTMLCAYQCYKHYTTVETEEQERVQYSYSLEHNVDYSVRMQPNELYPTEIVESGGIYITQLMNSLISDFETTFKASEVSNIVGTYRIDTEVVSYIVQDDIKKDIWCKRIPLVELKSFNEQTDTYQFLEQVEVDYASQRVFVEALEETMNMSLPVEVRIHLVGNIKIENPYETYTHPLDMQVIASLTGEYTEVGVEGVEGVSDEIKVVDTITLPPDVTLAIGYASVAVILLIGVVLLGVLTREATEKERYEAQLKRIFREYGSRIVEIEMLNISRYEIHYSLTTLDDLIKVADELERPITYHNNQADTMNNNFCVVHEKTLYSYTL